MRNRQAAWGETLARMLVAFDRTGVQGRFRGYIDDIYIGVNNMR
jgi:hypothetical protein